MGDILYPLRRLHGSLHDRYFQWKSALAVRDLVRNTSSDQLFFVLTPTHGNLGDHAIAQSVAILLQEMKQGYQEITANQLALLKKFHYLSVFNGKPILVNGGGNLGTLWPATEELFRSLIKSNPNSPILCLPNTIYYEDSVSGRLSLVTSKQIYNSHPYLRLCAREKNSYMVMSSLYPHTSLIPDMALFLNETHPNATRRGCILCLRSDLEKTRTDTEEQTLWKQVTSVFGTDVRVSDMNIHHTVRIEDRQTALAAKYAEFRSAELVVTDRLHGMIFAAITGTPCIVCDSKSPKVRGCYEWLKEVGYVRFLDHPQDLESVYRTMPLPHDCRYDPAFLTQYRTALKELIAELVK